MEKQLQTFQHGRSRWIELGKFRYNSALMELQLNNESTKLSAKESDLLQLLHANENEVLVHENILKEVWGDNGLYIGRKLDVYISRLRVKLKPDPDVRILNIRGIGYKLAVA